MGVLNVTPDSFSDGGKHFSCEDAVARAKQMIAEGADIIDIGGESTRPGAEPVTEQEELRRVLPVIEALRGQTISIDTSKPEVARQAAVAGAAIINDVTGFRNEQMLRVAADAGATICIMHMLGEPRTMQIAPQYDDVVGEVTGFLLKQAHAAQVAGISREKIWLDPGIGFGKTLEHNIALLGAIPKLADTGYKAVIGASRKSFIGKIADEPDASNRLAGSLAAAIFAASRGAHILRIHDVAETRQALRVWSALKG